MGGRSSGPPVRGPGPRSGAGSLLRCLSGRRSPPVHALHPRTRPISCVPRTGRLPPSAPKPPRTRTNRIICSQEHPAYGHSCRTTSVCLDSQWSAADMPISCLQPADLSRTNSWQFADFLLDHWRSTGARSYARIEAHELPAGRRLRLREVNFSERTSISQNQFSSLIPLIMAKLEALNCDTCNMVVPQSRMSCDRSDRHAMDFLRYT